MFRICYNHAKTNSCVPYAYATSKRYKYLSWRVLSASQIYNYSVSVRIDWNGERRK